MSLVDHHILIFLLHLHAHLHLPISIYNNRIFSFVCLYAFAYIYIRFFYITFISNGLMLCFKTCYFITQQNNICQQVLVIKLRGPLFLLYLCSLAIFHVSANKHLPMVVELWVEEEAQVVLAIHVAKVVISHVIAHKVVVMVVDLVAMVVDKHNQLVMVVDLVAMEADNCKEVVMVVDN